MSAAEIRHKFQDGGAGVFQHKKPAVLIENSGIIGQHAKFHRAPMGDSTQIHAHPIALTLVNVRWREPWMPSVFAAPAWCGDFISVRFISVRPVHSPTRN